MLKLVITGVFTLLFRNRFFLITNPEIIVPGGIILRYNRRLKESEILIAASSILSKELRPGEEPTRYFCVLDLGGLDFAYDPAPDIIYTADVGMDKDRAGRYSEVNTSYLVPFRVPARLLAKLIGLAWQRWGYRLEERSYLYYVPGSSFAK